MLISSILFSLELRNKVPGVSAIKKGEKNRREELPDDCFTFDG